MTGWGAFEDLWKLPPAHYMIILLANGSTIILLVNGSELPSKDYEVVMVGGGDILFKMFPEFRP